jgi:hypothetical protein
VISAVVSATKVVDIGQLTEVVYVSLIAGVGVSLAFSIVIRGAVRAGEHGRGRPIAAAAHALTAIVGLIIVLASLVFGVSTMLSK